jgi:hypothetical protein
MEGAAIPRRFNRAAGGGGVEDLRGDSEPPVGGEEALLFAQVPFGARQRQAAGLLDRVADAEPAGGRRDPPRTLGEPPDGASRRVGPEERLETAMPALRPLAPSPQTPASSSTMRRDG